MTRATDWTLPHLRIGARPLLAPALLSLLLAACATTPAPAPTQAAASPPDAAVPAATASADKPASEEAGAVADNKIAVDFAENSAVLTATANHKLDLAARLYRDANPVLMFTTGHSDTTGNEYANLLLSAKRAQVVKQALVARGIPADRLLLQALGSSDPVGGESADTAGNRSVVVTWRLGKPT